MLSSIFISGTLGKNLGDGFRMVDVQSPTPGSNGKFPVFHLPILCKMLPKSYFFTAPEGSLITLKGRLEMHEQRGLIIVNELDEIYSANSDVKKTVVGKKPAQK